MIRKSRLVPLVSFFVVQLKVTERTGHGDIWTILALYVGSQSVCVIGASESAEVICTQSVSGVTLSLDNEKAVPRWR